MIDLTGKVALITGAGRGLGAETARTLAQHGAAVALSDIDHAAAERQAQALKGDGLTAIALAHDVADEAAWQTTVAGCVEQLGGLDVLVNNAGVESMAPFADCELADFERIQSINVTGTFLGIKHAIRAMRPDGSAGRGGSIINLSSVAGLMGVTGLGAYCTSKGAVRLMSKAAAVECAQLGYGIRVNSIHPGLIKTDMGLRLIDEMVRLGLAPDAETAEAGLTALHPMGLGAPENVAKAVAYLASDASAWTSGAELSVDGAAAAA